MFFALLSACGPEGRLVHPLEGPPEERPDAPARVDTGREGLDEAPGKGFPFDAPGEIFAIALSLDAAAIDALERDGPYVRATFRFAGYEASAGVRYKGSSTYDELDGKPSFKIDFGEFAPDARFLGVERGIGNMNRPCPKTTTPAVPASTPASAP